MLTSRNPRRAASVLRSVFQPTDWVPDHSVSACMACGHAFSVTVRRHHCRHCGRLVCGACSPHKTRLPQAVTKTARVRVCGTCFRALGGADGEPAGPEEAEPSPGAGTPMGSRKQSAGAMSAVSEGTPGR